MLRQCLNEQQIPPRPWRRVSVGGVERPLGQIMGTWASSHFIANIMMILLREVLFYETVLSLETDSSLRLVEALAGGAAANGRDFCLEVWFSVAKDTIQNFDPMVHPISLGAPGYDGFEGLFVGKRYVDEGRLVGDFLTFHLTYNASLNIAGKYFAKYLDIADLVLDSAVTACAEDNTLSFATAAAAYHEQHTGDSSGITPTPNGPIFKCSGPSDAVWLSPACRRNLAKCIPVASTSGWGLIQDGLSQKYVYSAMAVGVLNYKYQDYIEVVKASAMLFYAWVPDPVFSALEPMQVSFPAHNSEEWKRGMRASSQGSGEIRKMVRAGLEKDVPADVWLLLQEFVISLDQVNEYMKRWPIPADEEEEFRVACSWVKENNGTWENWKLFSCPKGYYAPADGRRECRLCLAGYYCPPTTTELQMLEHFACPSDKWCPTGSDVPQPCKEGRYLSQHRCLECPYPKYSSQQASLQCEECAFGMGFYGVNGSQTGCALQWGYIIITISIVALLIFFICKLRQRLRAVVEDGPDRASAFAGSWVQGWIGEMNQSRLMEVEYDSDRRISRMGSLNSDPMHVEPSRNSHSSHQSATFQSSRTSNFANRGSSHRYCCPARVVACRKRLENRLGIRKARQLLRRPDFLVNSTPFQVHVSYSRVSEPIPAFSFCKVGRISRKWMRIVIAGGDDEECSHWQSWMPTFQGELQINLDASDWENAKSFRGSSGSGLLTSVTGLTGLKGLDKTVSPYDNRVIRVRLPVDDSDSYSTNGEIKLVWRRHKVHHQHGEVLIVTWSPPHTLRGMPIEDFVVFLDKVIEHNGTWFGSLAGMNGSSSQGEKTYNTRNMYDANKYYLENAATAYDASYAEIRTFFGPADIFISHVWAENALNTKLSLVKVCEYLTDDKSKADVVRSLSTATLSRNKSFSIGRIYRVWFCTCCNNQGRIFEELGEDVHYSPFARVLRSAYCTRVILVSPLKALERKWCNYEFSLAVLEGKEPLMVTKEGVVQAGQVAPRSLKELSDKVVSFSCSSAKCSSAADEALIDNAVELTGGYIALDMRLKRIFHEAIINAHEFTAHALKTMETYSNLDDAAGRSISNITIKSSRSGFMSPTRSPSTPWTGREVPKDSPSMRKNGGNDSLIGKGEQSQSDADEEREALQLDTCVVDVIGSNEEGLGNLPGVRTSSEIQPQKKVIYM